MKEEAREVAASSSLEPAASNVGRRNMALTMLGALGAAAMVGARGSAKTMADVKPEPTENAQGAPPTTGTEIMWVDTVFGSGGPGDRVNGDLNKGPLALNSATPPMVVIAKGAVTIGDGGGGIFFWNAVLKPVDDGGTKIIPQITVPAGPNAPPGVGNGGPPGNGDGNAKAPDTHQRGYWHRIYDGPLNVKWFGTGEFARKGIQAAIDAATNAGGGSVYIPPGRYDIDEAIEVKSNVELRGAGPATLLRLRDNMPCDNTMQLKGVVIKVQGSHNIRIADLRVDGNKDNNQYICSETTLSNGSTIKHPTASLQNGILVRYGLQFGAQPGTILSEDILIENCISSNSIWHGIGVLSSHRVTVRNCITNDCGKGDAQANGIDFSWDQYEIVYTPHFPCPTRNESGYGVPNSLEDCVAEGCSAFGNLHSGLETSGAKALRTTFRYCHSDSILVNVGPLQLQEFNLDASILDCSVDHRLRNTNDPAINLTRASGVLVANCRLVAMQVGIDLDAGATPGPVAHGNTIVGNTMTYMGPCIAGTGICPQQVQVCRQGPCGEWCVKTAGGYSQAVYTQRQRDLVIANNTAKGFREGISIYTGENVVVAKNTILSAQDPVEVLGIYLFLHTSNTAITKNTIRNHNYGVVEDGHARENVIAYNVLRDTNQMSWNPGPLNPPPNNTGPGPNFPQRSEHNMI